MFKRKAKPSAVDGELTKCRQENCKAADELLEAISQFSVSTLIAFTGPSRLVLNNIMPPGE